MRSALPAAALLLATAPAGARPGSAAADTIMLKLRDGRVLWGTVAAHDAEQLTFRRLDTGGVVELPWEFLDPRQDREMRLLHGYIEPEGEELLVSAERIPIVDGPPLVGVVLSRGEDTLMVKTAGGTLPLSTRRVAGPSSPVQVPALEVYTRGELIQRKRDELGSALEGSGRAAAEAHFELGAFCERVLDFQSALAHFEVGTTLAPELRTDEVDERLEALRRKAAHQEQFAFLKEADRLRARGYYPEALARLELFAERYPVSPALEDWERVRARTLKGQERALREEVVRRWHFWVERHARQAALEKGYEATLSWLEGEMGEAVLESVRADVEALAPDVSDEDVRAIWEDRSKGRLRRASYGHGTWLLGEERAHAELEEDDEEEGEALSEREAERKSLRERMERYVEAQRQSARRSRQKQEQDPEDFWEELTSNERRHWITAYYAEFSGDMHVARVRKSNCRECGGTGVIEVLYLGSARSQDSRNRSGNSGSRLLECPTCRRVGIVRRIQYW